MDVIKFIKQNYDSFTEREKEIADYLILAKDSIIELSARDIAEKTNTSAPTVVRFAKKLGFSSLNEMKLKISINLEKKENARDFKYLDGDLDIRGIVCGIRDSIHSVIDDTVSLINEEDLEKAIDLLIKAKNIYVYGVGSSSLVGLDLYHKLARINKTCIVHVDTHLQMASSTLVNEDDVVIAISYSGETKEILRCAENAKSKGTPVISITKSCINNKLEKLSDITLKVPAQEKNLREGAISSRTSQLIIIDILYLGIARDNVKEVEEKLISTRKAIEYLK